VFAKDCVKDTEASSVRTKIHLLTSYKQHPRTQ